MALRTASMDRLLGNVRGLQGTAHQVKVMTRVVPGKRLTCFATAAAMPQPAAASNKYAILQLGGVRQMLQEGLLYSCPKHCLVQEQHQPHAHFSTGLAAGNGAGSSSACDQPPNQQHQAQQQQPDHVSSEQRSYFLNRVLGWHNGEQFTWGSPYVPNTLVEVEVVEEFQGPTPTTAPPAAAAAASAVPDSSMMTIYRVKHIRAAA